MRRLTSLLVVMGLTVGGCATERVASPAGGPVTGEDRSRLAGLWDYEEGTAAVELTLDERGNGEYLYKGDGLRRPV
jgi:hypothetical protein